MPVPPLTRSCVPLDSLAQASVSSFVKWSNESDHLVSNPPPQSGETWKNLDVNSLWKLY